MVWLKKFIGSQIRERLTAKAMPVAGVANRHAQNPERASRATTFKGIEAGRKLLFFFITCVSSCVFAQAATITLNESVLVNTSPMRIGVNVSTSNSYDSGQLFKNLLFPTNPGFEGFIQQEIVGCISGSATTCVNYYQWDQAPWNYWAGATAYFCCSASPSNANLGLTRTIASSTTDAGGFGPTYTFSSALPQPVATDDYFSVSLQVDSTGSSIPGWNLSGAASAETSNISPGSAGVQALSLPSGACATAYLDTTGTHDFIVLQTGQTFGFNLKTIAVSGKPVIKVSIARSGGVGGGVLPSSGNLVPGASWATQSLFFSGAESTGIVYGDLQVQLCNTGTGTAYVDDADLERTSSLNPSNTSVYRDEVVSSLSAINPGSLRLWDYQLGETLADWTNPIFGRHAQSSLQDQSYVTTSSGRNAGSMAQGLMDFFGLCELIGAKAWITIPPSWPVSDYSNLIDFLAGGANTTYGAKRIANGHAAPYTSTLGNIYIEFGNEPWNSIFGGINMPNFSYATTSNGMLSYGYWSSTAMSAMKANSNFSPALKLVVNMQAADTYEYISHVVPNNPYLDAVSVAPYIGGSSFNSAGTLAAEWNPDTAFTWADSNDTTNSSGNGWTYAYVRAESTPVYVYEDNENQVGGNVPTATLQNHDSSFMAGTVVAQQMLEHLKILGSNAPQHIWSLAQDAFKNPSSVSLPLYGIMKEAGGEWAGNGNYVQRPVALALQIANDSIIGPEYAAAVTGADTYTTGASNGLAAESNVPYEFTYCFMSNSNRSCVLVNTDPSSSHTFILTGSDVPTSVTTRVLSMAGGTIDTCNNESPIPCVSIVTTNNVPVYSGSITVPPGTIEGIDFVSGGIPPAISAVASSGITTTSATITWTTDQPSSSQVEFGTTPGYGSFSAFNASLVTSHSVILTGLTPGTTYDYSVVSADLGGAATSANFTFSTPAAIPAIGGVASSGITTTSATITWATDQPSSSQVEYGTTTGYGSVSALNSSPVTSHSVTLTGLTPGTTYDFAVLSTDSAGTATSANFAFSTLVPIPVISAVASAGITGNSATITWTTDQLSSSQVEYGTTIAYGSLSVLNSSLVTSHSVTLTGLTPGTTYYFAAVSTDSGGTATSASFTFSTPVTIPTISAVTASGITTTSATITWTTDQPASSQVEYGMTIAYGSLSALNSSLVTSHSMTLTGLTPGTTYNYAVVSTDSAGTATSANFSFMALVPIPVISAVTSSGITGNSATITWTTDQLSSSQVEYGMTIAYGSLSAFGSSLVASHSVTLTGLTPGTVYNFAVVSTDSGGTATSTNFTFSTLVTIPAISAVTLSGVTPTSAVITWTTDQPSSSQVEYGTTVAYGSLSALSPALVTSHSVTLTGLTPGATYNYAVISADSAGTATSVNFTFSVPVIAAIGGAHNNTSTNNYPASLSIGYNSGNGNTVVAVCALGNPSSYISSITDSGSTWALLAYAGNGTVRSEIWSTGAGSSVASTLFTISISGGAPASCALEEYAGVLSIGPTTTASGASGIWSVGLTTQDANDYIVAAIGANSFYNYSSPTGTIRQMGGVTSNSGSNYVEMALCDNAAAAPSSVTCAVNTAPSPWAAVAAELRSTGSGAGPIPVISAVASSGITGNSATITWTTDQPSSSQVEYGTTIAYGTLSPLNSSLVTSHSVTLSGLTPGTAYDFAVLSSDSAGTATSPNFTFSTPVTIPTISAVTASGITGNSAIITWTTDQPSSSQVEYGTTTGYGTLSALNSSLATSHSVTLTVLTPGTTYDFAVLSTDSAGTATSVNFTFSTPAPVPVISAIAASGITAVSATITWTTDQPSSSQVEFGTTTAYGTLTALNSSLVTSHSATLTGLTPGTTYDFAVLSADSAGTATSANYVFSTLVTIPAISSVASSGITTTSATITWTTDQPSTSQVEYGTTIAYGTLSTLSSSLVTSHSVTLTGLTPGATYDFVVLSADSAGTATSANLTFSTPLTQAPGAISPVGGAHNNTVTNATPTILQMAYASSNGNTVVAVCALGSTSASIGSITDSGSTWVFRAGINNGTAFRSEIWSTGAGGSVASTLFTINISGGAPASCAIEEYAGALSIGATAMASGVSGAWSVGLNTQEANDYIVAGIGANSYYSYSNPTGTIRQAGGVTSNPGSNYVEMSLFDNAAATASSVNCAVNTATSPWAAVALELRPVAATPVITSVASSGITGNSATITWTTDQPSSSQVEYGATIAYGTLSTPNSSLVTAHSVTLNGLTPGTTYDFAVLSADAAGISTSANFTFSTPVTIPTISAVASSGITGNSATITWTTDQPSSSQVEYGTTIAYGAFSALNPSLVTSHSATLTGLTPGTTYDFAVLSTDSAGTATSTNFTFSTPATIPAISTVTSSGITGNSATITWTTDQLSSSQVEYGTTIAYGSLSAVNSSLVTSHSVTLTGLTPGTTYDFAVLSTDTAGTATSANFTFSTPATVPTISAVASSGITGNSATITWTTDQPSSSQVEYGATIPYGAFSALNSSLVTSHSVTLTSLTPGTTYDFAVLSTDSAGTATSANFTFSTTATIPAISAVTSSGTTGNSATITWTTDQPSSSQVEYGTTIAYGSLSTVNSSLVTSHSVTLTGLAAGTTYDFAVLSTDSAGTATSANFTFSTTATVPTISAVTSSGTTGNSATITWTTDQPSNSQVEFGTTIGYGSLSALNSSLVTLHSVTLTGLTPGTTYDFAVLSADSAGTATSANLTFSTPATVPTISAVTSSGVTGNSVTIAWTTDQPSSSQVEYGITNGYGSLSALNSSLVTLHSVTLTGLTPGTTYDYAVVSADSAGTATSANFTFSTPVTIPTISAVASSANIAGSATVTWTTDQPSNSQVEYGTTIAYGAISTLSPSLVTSHSVTLTGLTPGATYDYVVISADSAGTAMSDNFTVSIPVIAAIGGGHNNTSNNNSPSSLAIGYASGNGNTVVAVCALGSASSSISSITDSGSTWAFLAGINNGTALRSEIWSTGAGASVASTLFNINISGGAPASCAIEEYAGVLSIGGTATASGVSGAWSVDVTTQEANDYVVSGLGANSFYSYSSPTGTIRQAGGVTSNAGPNYVEMSLLDSPVATVSSVTCAVDTATSPWAAVALELRPVAATPVITSVAAGGITGNSATITWTTDQPSSSQVEYGTTVAYGVVSTLGSSLVTSHSVTLNGLTPGTTYDFAVLSTDSAGTATSANFTFSTPVTIPTISTVASSGITGNSATIIWTTDQPSSSQVEYGITIAYGSLSTLGSSLVTSHSVTLTGLTPGTTYDFTVLSTDSAGTATSANFTFSTLATVPTISAVASSAIAGNSATITWTTDQPSSSQVEYGTTVAYGVVSTLGSSLVTSHSVTLNGLTPGTTYDFAVSSADSAGTATSANFTFSTAVTIPTISAVASSGITAASVTITWTTDQPSNSQIEYGTTIAYGSLSTLGAALVTSHSVTLTGLMPGTTYDFAVLSSDSAGTATSANFTFSTAVTIPTISAVATSGMNGNSVKITWTTDQPSSSQVEYGMTIAYGSLSTLNSSSVTSHSVTLNGLIPGTTYDFAVLSTDSAGTATSGNYIFSTPATIPTISAVASSAITAASVTITWTTDQPSGSQVEYGTTVAYGTLSTLSSALVTSHSVTLTGLMPGTNYDFAVLSTDSAGTATSANFTFSTPATVPTISAVASSGITAASATITWTTNQPSSSQVEYGTTIAYGTLSTLNSSLVTSHSVTLTGLTAGTTYDFAVLSADSAGTATSANFTFATSGVPITGNISPVGGAHGNTGGSSASASLSMAYSSSNGNTIVAVCAIGNTASSISSITDSGSVWARRAYVANGAAVRSEIWSTSAGGSVASTSFHINLAAGAPASCALEEYSGVQALGTTATNEATSGTMSVSLTAQETNDYIVAGLGANSYNGYALNNGTLRQAGGMTSNGGGNYVEMDLCDNKAITATSVMTCSSVSGPAPWAVPALQLR